MYLNINVVKCFFHFITAMFIIILFGITGNVSIIIIILKNKLLRLQPINLFLLNLAVSDLLHLCVSPILYLFENDVIFTNYYLGHICCLATPFFRGKIVKVKNNWLTLLLLNILFKIFSDIFCCWSFQFDYHNSH